MTKDKFHDFEAAGRHLQKKGLKSALQDGSVRPLLHAADKKDVERKAFLMALAQLCASAEGKGIDKAMIVDCLKAALDGMEHA